MTTSTPRQLTFSPTRLATVLQCPRRARQDEEGYRTDPGPDVHAGGLVHRALQALAGEVVTSSSLLREIEERRGRLADEAVERAREVAAGVTEIDLRHVVETEKRCKEFPVGSCFCHLVVDRVDEYSDGIGRIIEVVDYKTGSAWPTAEELRSAPQTVLYLAWAAEEFFGGSLGQNDSLSMIYHWPETDRKVRIPYVREEIEEGLANAELAWLAYRADPPLPPTPSPASCRHCNHRGDCSALDEELKKIHRRPEWDETVPMPELVALRHQIKNDSDMLDLLRIDLDEVILERLEAAEERKWKGDSHTASVSSRSSTSYSLAVLEAVAEITALTLQDVVSRICSVSGTKLKKLVARIESDEVRTRAEKVAAAHATKREGRPFLLVRAKGGLF